MCGGRTPAAVVPVSRGTSPSSGRRKGCRECRGKRDAHCFFGFLVEEGRSNIILRGVTPEEQKLDRTGREGLYRFGYRTYPNT